ncbi:unnamed protein product [Phytomonas sp. EM1]|nr:unnamed protein product [Phytomonas sp. EM1]|eukprot:CCW63030.1 unnamed protein product [Phytomonas sp. isolate EM1]
MNTGHAQETSDTDNMGNEANTQLLELQGAFIDALTNMGLMGKLKAQLRAVALALLRGDPNLSLAAVGPTKSFVHAPIETQISLLLINDFLTNNHLTQTAGVLEVEAGISSCSSCAEEQMRSSIGTLSGDGTMLERLIHFAINGNHTPNSHLSASPQAALVNSEPEPMLPSTRDKTSVDTEEAQETLLELCNPRLHDEINQYEKSISYSDIEECLNEDLYTEIELF